MKTSRLPQPALPVVSARRIPRPGMLAVACIALAAASAAPAHAAADAAIDNSAVTDALGRQADGDSLEGIAAEGALLYSQEPVKLDGYAYCGQSVALAERGEFRLSIRAASKALHIALVTQNADLESLAERDLAIAYSYSGNLDQAEHFAGEALKHAQKDKQIVIGPAHKIIGDVQARRHAYDDAIKSYDEAEQTSSDHFRPLVRASLINTLIDAGDIKRAREQFLLLPQQETPALRNQVSRTEARLLTAEKKPDEALKIYQALSESRGGGDANYTHLWANDGIAQASLALGDQKGALRAWDQAATDADAVRAEFRSEEIKMGLFSDVQRVFESAVGLSLELNDAGHAFALSERSRARALLDSVRGRARLPASQSTIDLPTLQALLQPDENLVEFHSLPNELVVWVVGQKSMRVVKLPLAQTDLVQVVEAFRNSIIIGKKSAVSGAEQIGLLLLKPLQLETGKRLIIVPNGPLHYLPFQALRLDGQYLIERNPISIAPSATIVAQLAGRRAAGHRQLVAFGNPAVAPKYDLPGSEAEVKAVSGYFDDKKVFLREDATKTNFRSAAASAGMVHVAAHAMADTVDPLYSRILLANENNKQSFLEAREVLDLDLGGVSIVTLSACESGLGKIASGDETLGFTRSFLEAGSPALIASLWPVSDDSAELLMSTLYKNLADGADVQTAMQAAQLAVLHNPKMQHPFFWAPFNLIGNWRLTVKQ